MYPSITLTMSACCLTVWAKSDTGVCYEHKAGARPALCVERRTESRPGTAGAAPGLGGQLFFGNSAPAVTLSHAAISFCHVESFSRKRLRAILPRIRWIGGSGEFATAIRASTAFCGSPGCLPDCVLK